MRSVVLGQLPGHPATPISPSPAVLASKDLEIFSTWPIPSYKDTPEHPGLNPAPETAGESGHEPHRDAAVPRTGCMYFL